MDAEFTAELRPDSRDHLDAMPLVGIPANTIRKMMQTTGAEEDKKWLEGKVRLAHEISFLPCLNARGWWSDCPHSVVSRHMLNRPFP